MNNDFWANLIAIISLRKFEKRQANLQIKTSKKWERKEIKLLKELLVTILLIFVSTSYADCVKDLEEKTALNDEQLTYLLTACSIKLLDGKDKWPYCKDCSQWEMAKNIELYDLCEHVTHLTADFMQKCEKK